MSLLRQLFLENIHLKLIALVASLGLFFFVRGDRHIELSTSVPVLYTLPETRVLVSEPEQHLRLTLSGRQSQLRALLRKGLEPVTVDLTDFTGGVLYFDDSLVRLPPAIKLLAVQPARQELEFEPRARRAVPVAPNLVGTPDPAFRLVEVVVQPSKVAVEGAESLVRSLKEVKTIPITMDGRWESTSLEVGLSQPDGALRYEAAAKVKVRLTFEPRYQRRTFGPMPIEVINTTWETTVRPRQVRVTVEAPVRLLPGLDAASFKAVVDAQRLESRPAQSSHRLDVELENLPDTVKLLEIRPPRALVHLNRRLPREEASRGGRPDAGVRGDAGVKAPADAGKDSGPTPGR